MRRRDLENVPSSQKVLKGNYEQIFDQLGLRSALGRRLTYPELGSRRPGVARSYEPPGEMKPYSIEKGGLPVPAGNEDHHWSRVGQVPEILLAFAQRDFTPLPLLGLAKGSGSAQRPGRLDALAFSTKAAAKQKPRKPTESARDRSRASSIRK
jgi:hypothetical protein